MIEILIGKVNFSDCDIIGKVYICDRINHGKV